MPSLSPRLCVYLCLCSCYGEGRDGMALGSIQNIPYCCDWTVEMKTVEVTDTNAGPI